ncbi:MAG: 2Fe-2S iron-sulfur cluster binding domain-containing protein [Alphaproteobacteria bacterium]|nr:2Fe-2S iron-sulfur cluster binding domain-containing protein [Alphaproteobacteria bacterium]
MPNIFVTTPDGEEHTIAAELGLSLMEAIVQKGLPMEAICGGCLSCATCHVHVDPEQFDLFEPKSEDEEDMLDLATNVVNESRLSCQLKIEERHEELRVTIAEE